MWRAQRVRALPSWFDSIVVHGHPGVSDTRPHARANADISRPSRTDASIDSLSLDSYECAWGEAGGCVFSSGPCPLLGHFPQERAQLEPTHTCLLMLHARPTGSLRHRRVLVGVAPFLVGSTIISKHA